MKKINSTQRDTYAQISKAYTPANCTQRGDWSRFVAVPCVSEASKLRSFLGRRLFPAVPLSGDQSPVKYGGILLNRWACHGKGPDYQLSANTLMQMKQLNTDPPRNLSGASLPLWAAVFFFFPPSLILLYPLDCSSSYYASSLSIRGGTEFQHFLDTFCNSLGKFALSSVNLTSLAKTADHVASPHQLMALLRSY